MMESSSQDPNLSMSTASTSPPSSIQPPHDFLSMMATAVPAAAPEEGMDSSRAVGPMSLGSALSSQQGKHSIAFSVIRNHKIKMCSSLSAWGKKSNKQRMYLQMATYY